MGSDTSSLHDILARHPWPERWDRLGPSLDTVWDLILPHPPSQLWPVLIDTSRINHAIGVSHMEFEEREGRLFGQSRNLGVLQTWEEIPWDWEAEAWLRSVRVYERGFAHCARAIYELEPTEGGTRLRIYFGWIPRGWFSRMVLKLGAGYLERGYRRLFASLPATLPEQPAAVPMLKQPAGALSPDAEARLTLVTQRAKDLGASASLIEALALHIREGDEKELDRVRVVPLARRLDVSERDLLEACLHATRAGMLELKWEVICPHCRGVREAVTSLGDVPTDGACDVCAVSFTTDAENAVEISFAVNPAIRNVPPLWYCSAEPSTKRHIVVQRALAPGDSAAVDRTLAPGDYRVRLRGADRSFTLTIGEGSSKADWAASQRSSIAVAEGGQLTLQNDTDAEQTFVIEQPSWWNDALRPSRLFSLQRFRDLFSEAYLGAEVRLSVGHQTILFTDIVGSTQFYRDKGDPEAFVHVRRHFEAIFRIVSEHDGAVVKTIGDAVMAAFVDPLFGVRAAFAIHRHFAREDDAPITVRASLHAGSCIAVNLNAGIDYFGSTVNLAAKLQSLADANEVAVSEAVLAGSGVREYLDAEAEEAYQAHLEQGAFEGLQALVVRVGPAQGASIGS